MAVLASLIVCGLLWAGAEGALTDWGVSIGTLTAFVLLFRRFFSPIATLGEEWQTVQSALSGAERVFQVLALPVEETPAVHSVPRERTEPHPLTHLKNVIFAYVAGRLLLQGFSYTFRYGRN